MSESDDSDKIVLSDLVDKYDGPHKHRYVQKLTENGLKHDPYLLPDSLFTLCQDSEHVPDLQYPDIYNYLINSKSGYTAQSMKAYKSLSSYQYFVAGFVAGLRQYAVTNSVLLILAKVSYIPFLFPLRLDGCFCESI